MKIRINLILSHFLQSHLHLWPLSSDFNNLWIYTTGNMDDDSKDDFNVFFSRFLDEYGWELRSQNTIGSEIAPPTTTRAMSDPAKNAQGSSNRMEPYGYHCVNCDSPDQELVERIKTAFYGGSVIAEGPTTHVKRERICEEFIQSGVKEPVSTLRIDHWVCFTGITSILDRGHRPQGARWRQLHYSGTSHSRSQSQTHSTWTEDGASCERCDFTIPCGRRNPSSWSRGVQYLSYDPPSVTGRISGRFRTPRTAGDGPGKTVCYTRWNSDRDQPPRGLLTGLDRVFYETNV